MKLEAIVKFVRASVICVSMLNLGRTMEALTTRPERL